jgi:hypothetical protein
MRARIVDDDGGRIQIGRLPIKNDSSAIGPVF